MERNLTAEFQGKVHAALNNKSEEEQVYDTLKDYVRDQNVNSLVDILKRLFANPYRLHLFEEVRPFIAISHQVKYDRLCPIVPGKKLKTIYLRRHGIEDLGFKIRGGLDFGTGIFVSEVIQESLADINGLKPGDEIVRISGYSLGEATHSEVLALMKLRMHTLELKVRRMGLIPVKQTAEADVSWSFVVGPKTNAELELDEVTERRETATSLEANDRKVFVNLASGAKLGCGIGSNKEWGDGIFVCRVNPGGMAERLGFKTGDQVIEVNGVSFLDISHDEAVLNMKTSRYLTVVLRSQKIWHKGSSCAPCVSNDSFDTVSSETRPCDTVTVQISFPEIGDPDLKKAGQGLVIQGRVLPKSNPSVPPTINAEVKIEHPQRVVEDDKESLYAQVQKPKKQISQTPESNGYMTFGATQQAKAKPEAEPKAEQKVDWWDAIPSTLFTPVQIDDRELRKVEIVKDGPLNIFLEGGNKTPLGGKIVVADIYPDGAAFRSKALCKGDQIMMVEGEVLVDVPLETAELTFKRHMSGRLDGSDKLRMIVAVQPPKSYEDEITFF